MSSTRGMRFSRLKTPAAWAAQAAIRLLPASWLRPVPKAAAVAMKILYWAPGNPLRRVCRDVSILCARAGHDWTPFRIYAGVIGQLEFAASGYLRLFSEGPDYVRELVDTPPEIRFEWTDLCRRHGGLVIAAPHNACSVLAAVWFSKELSALILSRRYRSGRRRSLYSAFFERIEAHPVHPVEDEELCLSSLRQGGIIVEALDKIHRGSDGVRVTMFGRPVRVPPWAPTWAAEGCVPMLPCYLTVVRGRIKPIVGRATVSGDPGALAQASMTFFEEQILSDPASWTFMLDKRWRRLIREAVTDN